MLMSYWIIKMSKVVKKRDPNWKWRRALGHKVVVSKKRYTRKKGKPTKKIMYDYIGESKNVQDT